MITKKVNLDGLKFTRLNIISGILVPAGTNVVVVDNGSGTYLYDILAGFVDLSPYTTKLSLAAMVRATITTLPAGQTTLTVSNTNFVGFLPMIINAELYDATTGERLFADTVIAADSKSVTVNLSSAYANNINVITYYVNGATES